MKNWGMFMYTRYYENLYNETEEHFELYVKKKMGRT